MGDTGYSQLPEDVYKLSKIYYPSDNVVDPNDNEDPFSGALQKIKVMILRTTIYQNSLFRFKFDMRSTDGIAVQGRIYKNGSPIGTLQTTTSTNYVTLIEDLNVENWQIGDTIELWVNGGGSVQGKVRNFRLCGTASEFENTLS